MKSFASAFFSIGVSVCAIGSLPAQEPAAELRGTLIAVTPKASEAWLIDLEKRETIKVLPTGKGPHDVAVSPEQQARSSL